MATENGVSLRFYRNLFPPTLKALEAYDRDGVASDIAVTLPDFRLRDPWTLSRTKDISRCYGAILDATLTVPEAGELRLAVPQGGGQRRLFSVRPDGSLDELALKAAEVAGMPQFTDRRGKTAPEQALVTEPVERTAGEAIRLRAYFAMGGHDNRFFAGIVTNGVFTAIPRDCLSPSAPASTRPRLAVGNPVSAPTPDLDDDEPDSLSWEILSQNRAFIGHFLDWAATNPPPKGAVPEGAEAAPAAYPFIRARLAEVALSANQAIWCNTNFVKGAGCVALKGPPFHYHVGSSASFEFDVAEEGDYRLWRRYWRPAKNFSGTFNVSVSCAPSGSPATDGLEVFTSALAQTFARTPHHPYRPCDPIPDIRSTPYPSDGWAWEGSHRLAHLKPGRHRVTFTTGTYPDQRGAVVSDVLLTADPMLDPAVADALPAPDESAQSKDAGISHGVLPASPAARNPLLSMRPRGGTKTPPAIRDWWRRWRDALFDKLCDAEYSDYVWGYLASLNYFDEDSNLIGRVREVRAQKTADVGAAVPDTVGDGDLAFWAQNPFAPFTRFSPPSSGWRQERGTSVWTPLPDAEIGRTEHEAKAMSGEVKSLMLLVRNNAGEARVIEPVVESELPAEVRLVAHTVTSAGFWSPQILLKRKKVVCPPHQNTALWLTVDCRKASEGEHAVTLRFADKAVTWRVKVAGSLSAAPTPITYGWAQPYARKSCWETYRDYGINAVKYMPLSRRVMDEYGIRLLVGIPHGNIGANAAGSNEVRRAIERAERLGQRPEEYCWYLIDEPGLAKIPHWIEMAETVKGVDSRQQIWCNIGEGHVRPENGELYFKMMEYWDVACPFLWQFNRRKEFPLFNDKLHEAGRIKLLYHTLDIGSTEKRPQAPQDILDLAESSIREGRDGFANFTLMSGAPFDDLYIDNQDLAVSIYPGAWGRTLSTRNLEAWREGIQRWRKAKMKQIDSRFRQD
ncbi:MAG: hypothetical protein IJK04_00350 [Kiritimatiellae bacterium]|nr:hypothetical protein [Kiritimatiellia bacterium]